MAFGIPSLLNSQQATHQNQQPAEFQAAQPLQNICDEVNSPGTEVFYGPRENLVAYSNARQSYQRLCATTPTTQAEYAAWVDRAKALQNELSDLQSQDGKFNAEVAAAVEFYPEYLHITSAALQAVGAGMKEGLVKAGRYQVDNPNVSFGAARHFAAQQVVGVGTAFTNFWPAYDAIQTAQANRALLPDVEYIQQVGGNIPGVVAPLMVAAGLQAGLKSAATAALPKGGAPLAVTPEGFAVAGVSASVEGAVAQAVSITAALFRASDPEEFGDPFGGMGEWSLHNIEQLKKLMNELGLDENAINGYLNHLENDFSGFYRVFDGIDNGTYKIDITIRGNIIDAKVSGDAFVVDFSSRLTREGEVIKFTKVGFKGRG